MAAIIAQLTIANRKRKERGKYYLPADKCVYKLPPFDERFSAEKHNRYLINKERYLQRKGIRDVAKGSKSFLLYLTFVKVGSCRSLFSDLSGKVMADDLEFYYFMRYGKIPKTISNPGLAEFLKKDKQACRSMNLLKASVAFFGLFQIFPGPFAAYFCNFR